MGAKMRKPSIVYYEDRCAGAKPGDRCEGCVEWHEVFFGTSKNRKYSIEDGLWVALCSKHHRWSPDGIHGGNRELDLELKRAAQVKWMEYYNKTETEFRKRYGKSYLPVRSDYE